MSYKNQLFLIISVCLVFASSSLCNAEVQIPNWFKISVYMAEPPELGKQTKVTVEINPIIGNIEKTQVELLVPKDWKIVQKKQNTGLIKEGDKRQIVFKVTPRSYLIQGSIIAEATFTIPKKDLINRIKRIDPKNAINLAKTVNSWPDITKKHANTSFALTAEESFYPITGDMWISYDNNLIAQKGFMGPVFYEEPSISSYQAQTDVDMFDKLTSYLQADPALAAKIEASGVDLNKKRFDQLIGLYVLSVKAYQKKDLKLAASFIEQFENTIKTEPANRFSELRIASANLKGLIFWARNLKRPAEDAFKKAFYTNRKHPLQRYILRNLGLLMLSKKDTTTALEMFRLAQNLKKGYTLLSREIILLKKSK